MLRDAGADYEKNRGIAVPVEAPRSEEIGKLIAEANERLGELVVRISATGDRWAGCRPEPDGRATMTTSIHDTGMFDKWVHELNVLIGRLNDAHYEFSRIQNA